MEAASQNTALLLASQVSGQGAGAFAVSPAQSLDNSMKSVTSSFLSSFNLSSQTLPPEPAISTGDETEGLLQAVSELLTGQTATTDSDLPLFEGQDLAAEMSNEDVLSLISQLQGPEVEALVGKLSALLEGLTEPTANESPLPFLAQPQTMPATFESESTTQQSRQQVDALFSNIRQLFANTASFAELAKTTVANEETTDQLAQQAQIGDRRLLERLNSVSAQSALTSDMIKVGDAVRQLPASSEFGKMADNNASFSNLDALSGKPVVTPVPVLLERMAVVSNEAQQNSGLLELSDSANLSASIVQSAKAEPQSGAAALRPAASVIMQSPLTAPQWQSEFNDKVMSMSRVALQGQNQVAEIRLNPAHMGPIEVRVMMKDEQASILFSAQNGVVRDAIEASLPRLREMFNNSGLMLADANVSEQSPQERHKQNQNEFGNSYVNTDTSAPMNEATEMISQINLSAMSSSTRLDLYA